MTSLGSTAYGAGHPAVHEGKAGGAITGRSAGPRTSSPWARSSTLRPARSRPLRLPGRTGAAVSKSAAFASVQPATSGVAFQGLSNIAGRLPADPDVAASGSDVFEIAQPFFQIFSTSGAPLTPPTPTSQLWSALGGPCAAASTGDWSQVLYDQTAARWVYARSVHPTRAGVTYSVECLAVSQTSDPTGSWYLYNLLVNTGSPYTDYPQFGMWTDAYYLSLNLWSQQGGSGRFEGDRLIALNRSDMLAGLPLQTMSATLGSSFETIIPVSLEGGTPPPAGSPEYFLGGPSDFEKGGSTLEMFMASLNWATPADSKFAGPITIPVGNFNLDVCNNPGDACAPQPGTNVELQAFTDNLMLPVGYRNMGTYQSIVLSFDVNANGVDAPEWIELRNPGYQTQVYQEGVYAPDGSSRYNQSIGMDAQGDIALAYSLSSKAVYPSLALTGRSPSDPLGQMTLPEQTLWRGGGSQTGASRWGDASYLALAPDGCTFWYAGEYYPVTSPSSWSTAITSFQYPGCQANGGQ